MILDGENIMMYCIKFFIEGTSDHFAYVESKHVPAIGDKISLATSSKVDRAIEREFFTVVDKVAYYYNHLKFNVVVPDYNDGLDHMYVYVK